MQHQQLVDRHEEPKQEGAGGPRRRMPALQRNASETWTRGSSCRTRAAAVDLLEVQLQRSKESERKMLESLVSQTKQLELTKVALEESKLEIQSLQEIIKTLEKDDDVSDLQTELQLAIQAEAKSKLAMDDLAMALKEVNSEVYQAKEEINKLENELASCRAENERLITLVQCAEKKTQAAAEEAKRLKMEAEESTVAWSQKENGFIEFMKLTEVEAADAKHENLRLIEALRSARDESSRLRDIVKQAINEANVVKDALEIARAENSRLQDSVAEKDLALQALRQEHECLKVSEAAAVDSVRELSSLLTATSSFGSAASSLDNGSFSRPLPASTNKTPAKSASFDQGSIFAVAWSPEMKKDREIAGKSCSDYNDNYHQGRKGLVEDDGEGELNMEEFYYKSINGRGKVEDWEMEAGASPSRQKKKRPSFRKIGDILRRSFHK